MIGGPGHLLRHIHDTVVVVLPGGVVWIWYWARIGC
jgi:hypothetical protein